MCSAIIETTCAECGKAFSYCKGKGRDRLYCSQCCKRKQNKGHAVSVTPETYAKIKRLKEQLSKSGTAFTFAGVLKKAVCELEKQENDNDAN